VIVEIFPKYLSKDLDLLLKMLAESPLLSIDCYHYLVYVPDKLKRAHQVINVLLIESFGVTEAWSINKKVVLFIFLAIPPLLNLTRDELSLRLSAM